MKFLKNENGFTLIDIIIALIIILLFMSIISVLFFNITKSSKEIERESQATYIATNILESYKAKKYDDIPIVTDKEIKDGEIVVDGQTIQVQEGYTALVTVENYVPTGEVVANAPAQNDLVKKITVTVKYKLANSEKQVQLQSSVARK
ncbi:MAG: hypothetical protein J5881_01550 [Clostridia bacterium]|nr:hypothetical protein [Clostridia bacterium]